MQIPEKFKSSYNPADTEDGIYALWEESGFFNPDVCIEKGVADPDADTFSIVLPPLNVTGTMHTGHAAMVAIEEIMVRYNRMKEKRTLWIPGTDHAAIATQAKVEKLIYKKEGKNRHDLGRDEFLKRVEAFAEESHDTIIRQLKKLGASLDWSREAYTLDEKRERAVLTSFKEMYEKGLIYRDYRVVNWDPKGQTTVSDDEVVHEESKGVLYIFKYTEDFPIAIATTRPETKLGDTAVAVHPDDSRYSKYVGNTYSVEFAGVPLEIRVVADEAVDPEFGTGAVGITPAHSYTDWRIARRHNLPMKQVINEYAQMENTTDEIDGKKTKEAREYVVKWLKENDLLEKEEGVEMNIARADRSGGIIEPLPKEQWFIDVDKEFTVHSSQLKGIEDGQEVTLKEMMRKVVESGQIEILPGRYERVYYDWIDKLHDWNISRQIWFGHRVPVFYCIKHGKSEAQNTKHEAKKLNDQKKDFIVSIEKPETCPICGECDMERDPDTLDTWFSSGLWTFSTLGWPLDDARGKPTLNPDETINPDSELGIYHPTDVLETGYDILFFWVARMILMSGFLLGDIPFHTVYLHGLVRDEHGRKMSKSLGNIIDPLDLIEESGADALRMALVVGVGPGSDNNLGPGKLKAHRHFSNKIWNASRFVLENLPDNYTHGNAPELTNGDKKHLDSLHEITAEISDDIENFRFHLASEKIYHYFWHTFADVIIEEYKDMLKNGEGEEKKRASWVLTEVLQTSLRLLHPFMPFITEEIWRYMPIKEKGLLMVTEWPAHNE